MPAAAGRQNAVFRSVRRVHRSSRRRPPGRPCRSVRDRAHHAGRTVAAARTEAGDLRPPLRTVAFWRTSARDRGRVGRNETVSVESGREGHQAGSTGTFRASQSRLLGPVAMVVFVGCENETGSLGSGDAPPARPAPLPEPLDCRPGTACAILPLRLARVVVYPRQSPKVHAHRRG